MTVNQLISDLPALPAQLVNAQRSPLRIRATYRIGAKPAAVFSLIGDLEGITRFFPMIHHASVSHQGGCVGEGSQRVCSIRGMGQVNEQIVWWNPPQGYAYQAKGRLVPLRNHLGVILLSAHADGGTVLEWRQYLQTRFGPLGWLFPFMMQRLMQRAVGNIAKLLGTSMSLLRN